MKHTRMITHTPSQAKEYGQRPVFTDISHASISPVLPSDSVAWHPRQAHQLCAWCGANKTPVDEHPVGTLCLLDETGDSHGLCDECAALWPHNLTYWIDAQHDRRRKKRAYDATHNLHHDTAYMELPQ